MTRPSEGLRTVADLRAWLSAAPPGTMVPADRLAELLARIAETEKESAPRPNAQGGIANVGCLSVKEAAARLRISHMTVYELVRRSQLRHVRVGARVLIPESALAEFVQNGGTAAPAHHGE